MAFANSTYKMVERNKIRITGYNVDTSLSGNRSCFYFFVKVAIAG